jgi:hypothetical protein
VAKDAASAKRWNEHVRLFVTFFNLTSIGVFGLGIVAPMTDRGNPLFYYWSAGVEEKLSLSQDFAINDVISWQAVVAVIGLHIFAHVLIGLTEPEE